jgi:hypothetical protein
MLDKRARTAVLVLTLLSALAPAALARPAGPKPRRETRRLYQVYKEDGRGGARIGFIDKTGRLVIGFDKLPEGTVRAGEFHDGRAFVVVKPRGGDIYSPRFGYVDETGALVIKPRFISAHDFGEGLAFVMGTDFQGFVDRQGRPVIKFDFNTSDRAREFHEGLAAVAQLSVDSEGRAASLLWGYVDRSGAWVVRPRYHFADDFSEGLAGVFDGLKYGFINRAGEMVIAPRFVPDWSNHYVVAAGRFSEGLACVNVGGAYGYIDKRGDFVIPPRFSRARNFSEGLAWVVTADETTTLSNGAGWIDRAGRWAVNSVDGRKLSPETPEFFVYAIGLPDRDYSEGLVPFFVYEGDDKILNGYINKRGEAVIKPSAEFNIVGPFVGGVAKVTFHGDWAPGGVEPYGYIDKTGRLIWRARQGRAPSRARAPRGARNTL